MPEYRDRTIRSRWLVVGRAGTRFVAEGVTFEDCILENHGVGLTSFVRCTFIDCTATGPNWPKGFGKDI